MTKNNLQLLLYIKTLYLATKKAAEISGFFMP
jgi:hypothetical protein